MLLLAVIVGVTDAVLGGVIRIAFFPSAAVVSVVVVASSFSSRVHGFALQLRLLPPLTNAILLLCFGWLLVLRMVC